MKKLLFVVAALVVMAVPVGVFAAEKVAKTPVDRPETCQNYGWDYQKLTDEQKAVLDKSFESRMEVRKESINDMLKSGMLTQEQADQMLDRQKERSEYRQANGCTGDGGPGFRGGNQHRQAK